MLYQDQYQKEEIELPYFLTGPRLSCYTQTTTTA